MYTFDSSKTGEETSFPSGCDTEHLRAAQTLPNCGGLTASRRDAFKALDLCEAEFSFNLIYIIIILYLSTGKLIRTELAHSSRSRQRSETGDDWLSLPAAMRGSPGKPFPRSQVCVSVHQSGRPACNAASLHDHLGSCSPWRRPRSSEKYTVIDF